MNRTNKNRASYQLAPTRNPSTKEILLGSISDSRPERIHE
jgi:hypothetical protein